MTKEEQIKTYMVKLGISEEEATQLYEDDAEDYIGEEGEAMTKKAKTLKNYTCAKSTKERKPREKKPDENKEHLVKILSESLDQLDIRNIISNPTKSINFEYCGEQFTLNLVRHRAKKNVDK